MSTAAQISANIANAQSSTGPRTGEGKAACSKNATTHGLFTAADFIRPGEEPSYAELHEALLHDLAPRGILENTLVDEIRRATWRLRRCGQVEAHLARCLDDGNGNIPDPMETTHPHAEKTQKSVDRARSQAHRLFHKCTAELRRLQTDRHRRAQPLTPVIPITEPLTKQTQRHLTLTPRNADCPCGSRLKYKRCCGKSAPPVLQMA